MIKAIIHCSDSPQGRGDTAETIHRWHKQRGFDGIGYHFVILEDGTVENGRPEYWTGAHAKGHNDAIGICLIGEDKFTVSQYISLEKIIKEHEWKQDEVVGHYAVSEKTCPNFNVEDFMTALENK
jgi:N-acetylmuramoyl-L-alanine amidase